MSLRKCFVALLLLLVLGFICAAQQQQVEIKKVPIQPVSPVSGEKMYVTYCAVCHGIDGKGTGPAVAALRTPPPDLTLLSQRNSGKFPEMRVHQVILGDSAMPAAHGTKDMPVWGDLFHSLCIGRPTAIAEAEQRVSYITRYVESFQK